VQIINVQQEQRGQPAFPTARYSDIPLLRHSIIQQLVFTTANFIPNSNSQLFLEIVMLFLISIC